MDLIQPNTQKSVLNRQSAQKQSRDGQTGLRIWVIGDDVMVRDFRQGKSWTPAVVTKVLGPVTYLVETPEGHHWKRHADQMKSVITVSEETASEAEFPLEVTPPTNPPTNLSPDPPDLPVDISDPPNVGNKSEGSSTSEERTSRYPTRTRRPPEQFQ